MDYTLDTPETKVNIQIKEKMCEEPDFPYVSAVILENVNYPVKVSWDSTLFSDDCLIESLITDTHPGGWFDVGGTGSVYFMNEHSSTSFQSTKYHYLEYYVDGTDRVPTDSIDVLFFALGSEEGGIVHSIDKKLSSAVNIYPVPASSALNIALPRNQLIDNYSIFNIKGEKHCVNREGATLNIENLAPGTYFLHLRLGDKNVVKKFIKK